MTSQMTTTFLFSSLIVFGVGCYTEDAAPMTNVDSQRAPIGKADGVGTCEGLCGGMSEGNCYCDDQCERFGDCCDDYIDMCIAEPNGTISGVDEVIESLVEASEVIIVCSLLTDGNQQFHPNSVEIKLTVSDDPFSGFLGLSPIVLASLQPTEAIYLDRVVSSSNAYYFSDRQEREEATSVGYKRTDGNFTRTYQLHREPLQLTVTDNTRSTNGSQTAGSRSSYSLSDCSFL